MNLQSWKFLTWVVKSFSDQINAHSAPLSIRANKMSRIFNTSRSCSWLGLAYVLLSSMTLSLESMVKLICRLGDIFKRYEGYYNWHVLQAWNNSTPHSFRHCAIRGDSWWYRCSREPSYSGEWNYVCYGTLEVTHQLIVSRLFTVPRSIGILYCPKEERQPEDCS